MEQAYGFTPTHTEQYISPTTHRHKTQDNFQASTRTKILADKSFSVCKCAFPFLENMLKCSDMHQH